MQSNRLNDIIQDVLRLSRKDSVSIEDIELSHWLDKFNNEFSEVHKLPNGWNNVQITPKDLTVLIDSNHLHQILWNLCTNAIKYANSKHTASVITFRGYTDSKSNTKYLDVIDNGAGVDPANRDKLFEPFYTTSSTGTGLGLYISRELCLSNGGDLNYVAPPEGGSCFRIRFPSHQTSLD